MLYKLIFKNSFIGYCYGYTQDNIFYTFHMINPVTGKPDTIEAIYRIKKENVKGIYTNDITETIEVVLY